MERGKGRLYASTEDGLLSGCGCHTSWLCGLNDFRFGGSQIC
jgi:hypothetical protein